MPTRGRTVRQSPLSSGRLLLVMHSLLASRVPYDGRDDEIGDAEGSVSIPRGGSYSLAEARRMFTSSPRAAFDELSAKWRPEFDHVAHLDNESALDLAVARV
jgi:hypothetical protein